MDNVNKPAAISVAATVIVCIAAVTLLVLLGRAGMVAMGDGSCHAVGNAAPAYRHGLYYLGMALSLLVLGFMAFRLLIKDKVKPSAAPVRQPTEACRGRSPLCPAEKAPSRTLPPALAAQSPPAFSHRRRGGNRTTGASACVSSAGWRASVPF